ncbi:hypothetical protein PCANB_001858 [Pneumocystis canis]|nr:hypothetical protein PCANB_001858 [Pneumocystis canis]
MIYIFFLTLFLSVLGILQDFENIQHNTLPVVLWHGLGDSYDSEEMKEISNILSKLLNTYVYSIYLDKNSLEDKNSGFFGKVDEQIDFVSQQLAGINELMNGFNAIGFSQGGLFLRGYIERYNKPHVVNFITFGTPHNGISDFHCPISSYICKFIGYIIKRGFWMYWIRENIVPLQYYRDPKNMADYLQYNTFLADINNEKEIKNHTYVKNLSSLKSFVMVEFSDDELIIPKESSVFNSYDEVSRTTIYLKESQVYKEDWIGLRQLDEKNALFQITIPGKHMEIDYLIFVYIVKKYFSGSIESENPVQWQSEEMY